MNVDEDRVRDLEARLDRLEATQTIENLMSRYGECIDNGYDLAALSELLSPDLEWVSNAFGEYHSRDEYLAGQERIGRRVAWAFHVMVPLRVRVDGSHAEGTFYLLMHGTFIAPDGHHEPIVLTARYDNRFVQNDDRWLVRRMEVKFHQVSRWSQAWVVERFWPE